MSKTNYKNGNFCEPIGSKFKGTPIMPESDRLREDDRVQLYKRSQSIEPSWYWELFRKMVKESTRTKTKSNPF